MLGKFFPLGSVGSDDFFEVFGAVVLDGLVGLQTLDDIHTEPRNKPLAVLNHSARSVSVALLALTMSVIWIEAEMRGRPDGSEMTAVISTTDG